jgi:hypothetical protein
MKTKDPWSVDAWRRQEQRQEEKLRKSYGKVNENWEGRTKEKLRIK